jgi:superfamily II DNA/RNA helicase
MSFDTLGLHEAIVKSVIAAGYETPTAVQAQAIPPALEGHDLRVCSNTGSGKTAAFVLPALQRVLTARADPAQRRPKGQAFGPRILVLTPTRELAIQVAKAADTYGQCVPGLKTTTVVGGVPYGAQLAALRKPLDMLIATPGRLIDHLESGKAVLASVELLVLDEADRMLDMGFIEDIERIAESLPAGRQTIMVSATFAGQVGRLADQILRESAQHIDVANHTDSHENITQKLLWADDVQHKAALLEHLLAERELQQAVVFTSTQRDADELAAHLYDLGHAVAPLHGGMPQGRRNRTLTALRRGELRVLVATDVAARGIDVPNISHVINFGLPMKAEDYVHRIGRTGRAGRSGQAITLAERRDASMIRRIQQFTTQTIPVGVIEGLEPKRPVPELFTRAPRHMERPGDRRGVHRGAAAHRGHPAAGGLGHRGEPRWHEGGDERRHDGPPRAAHGHAARADGPAHGVHHPRSAHRHPGEGPGAPMHPRRDGPFARPLPRHRGPGPR